MRWINKLSMVVVAGLGLTSLGVSVASASSSKITRRFFDSKNYVFFTSAASKTYRLRAFDPVTGEISTIHTGNADAAQYNSDVYDAKVNPRTGMVSNLHTNGVTYESKGAFHFVSSSQSGKLAVRQLSSYSGAICAEIQRHNYIVFLDGGSDDNCDTSGNHILAVTTNMSKKDSPISLPVMPLAVLFKGYSEATGLLYINDGNLYYSDARGGNVKTLANNIKSAIKIKAVGNKALLDIDGNYEVFNGDNGALIPSGYTNKHRNIEYRTSDAHNYYFFIGTNIYSIPLAGGHYAHVAKIAPMNIIDNVYVHGSYIVYGSVYNQTKDKVSRSKIYSVNMKTGKVSVIATAKAPADITMSGYGGNYVYYEILPSSNSDSAIAGSIRLDGRHNREIKNAIWIGAVFSPEFLLGQRYFDKYVELQKYRLDSSHKVIGADISIVNAATDTVISRQGALPKGIEAFDAIGISNQDLYGVYHATSGSSRLAHLNARIANSMQQLDFAAAPVNDRMLGISDIQ